MARNVKQEAIKRLEQRIEQRVKQGYEPINLPKYTNWSSQRINDLRYSNLDVYFQKVDMETGEVLTPKQYRQAKRELGYEEIPYNTVGTLTEENVYNKIEELIRTLESPNIEQTLLEILQENETSADYLQENQYVIASELAKLKEGYDETTTKIQLTRIANILSGGSIDSMTARRLGDAVERDMYGE